MQKIIEEALSSIEGDDPIYRAALSTAPRAYPPISVAVTSVGRPSIAKCDRVRVVDKSRLTRLAGALSADDLRAIENGVRQILGL